jgi:hypothetical protein
MIDDATNNMRTQGNILDQAYLQKWVAELSLEQQWKDACRGANPPSVNTAPE